MKKDTKNSIVLTKEQEEIISKVKLNVNEIRQLEPIVLTQRLAVMCW